MVLPVSSTALVSSLIRRRWLIGFLIAISGCFAVSARSQTTSAPAVHVENHAPVVSFDVFEPGTDGRIPDHPQTPPITYTKDANGVPEAHVGAATARHIATISAAASGMDNSDLDIVGALRRRKTVSNSEKAALDWLMRNYVEISNDAIVWHYTFTHTFNNIIIRSGWPSGFAQPDVIKAFVLAYARTSDKAYLVLAKRAGYAYSVPCEEGGLRCVVGGVSWFEEVPVPYGYAPMILNGHLYSVVMLHKLLEVTHSPRIAAAFQDGVDSAKRMLLRYDTGYWTIYQQRPRLHDVFLALLPRAADTTVHSVSVSSPVGRTSVLRLGSDETSTYPGNDVWGPGWEEEGDAWGRRLTGLARITILPGRLAIDHDPIHAGEFTVSVEYKSPGCVPPVVATFDYRARSKGLGEIPLGSAVSAGQEGCPAQTYPLPVRLNQWSTLTPFYHDWHTRLVSELWRITKDPKFYAAAVRWGRYAEAERKLDPECEDAVVAPIFDMAESPEDDSAVAAALNGKDPAELSDADVADAIRHWIESTCLPRRHALALLGRAGIAAKPDKLRVCTDAQPPGPVH